MQIKITMQIKKGLYLELIETFDWNGKKILQLLSFLLKLKRKS